MRTVVKMFTALLIPRLTVITVAAGKCSSYDNLVSDVPFRPVHIISKFHDMSCDFMSSDEWELYLIHSGINPLFPRTDGRCVYFYKYFIACRPGLVTGLQFNLFYIPEHRCFHCLRHCHFPPYPRIPVNPKTVPKTARISITVVDFIFLSFSK